MTLRKSSCRECGSSDMVKGVRVGQSAEVGAIGLSYKTRFLVIGTEPFVADLCRQCGEVRLYVKEKDRKWIVK